MEFKDALKMLRNELGLAQADIAIALHINIATVGRWEQGKTVPSRSFALALLDYARGRSASGECVNALENALKQAAKRKLFNGGSNRLSAEQADLSDMEARQKLADSHKQITSLLNDTPGGITTIELDLNDIAGTLHATYCNDRFFGYSGYDRDEYQSLFNNNVMEFLFKEDIPVLMRDAEKLCSGEIGASANATVRCHTKGGGFRWLLLTGQLTEKHGDFCVVNVVIVDVTQREEDIDRRRISEEILRIAAETDQRSIIVYDVKSNTCRAESRTLFSARFGEVFGNVPQSLIDIGLTAPDSEDTLRSLFARIREGEKTSMLLCSSKTALTATNGSSATLRPSLTATVCPVTRFWCCIT